MADGLETELKLAATPAMLLHLRGHALLAGKDHAATLVARYFDTKEGALHEAGAALRLREDGTRAEQTFKIRGNGSLHRSEWNVPARGGEPDPAAFSARPRKVLESLVNGASLHQLAMTRIERTTRRLRFGASTIEAAFDSGTVEAGRRRETISELELELVKGSAIDLFALARQLPLGPGLVWSVGSKGERGHALALKLPFAATRASDVPLSGGMTVAQGFQAIAWNCLAHLLGNYREIIASGNPEAVHQSRVAMRRLRAAFSLFGEYLDKAESAAFRAEWKAAASGLGPARDLHVLIERVEAAAAEHASDAGELLDRLRCLRAGATRAAKTLLAGKDFQHLLVRFAEWLERGPVQSDEPLAAFASRTLGRRRRRFVKAGPLGKLSDEALHRLRIKGKKLRYAAEFFAPLYPGEGSARASRAFGKALGKVQDCLGSVHDLAVAHDQHANLFAGIEPVTAARLSARFAELLESHGPGRRKLVKAAAKAIARIEDTPAWWKPPAGADASAPAAAD